MSITREPQKQKQREVEARVKALGNELARKQGISRRAFFTTAAGMASAFLAMNQVYGALLRRHRRRSRHSGTGPGARQCRSRTNSSSTATPISCATILGSTPSSAAPERSAMRAGIRNEGQEADHRGFEVQQLLQGNLPRQRHQSRLDIERPSEIPRDWFLTNEMMAQAREKVNKAAGSRRMLATPSSPRQARLARRSRSRHGAQARFHQGLHHRRQHPQGAVPPSLAHGR